MRYGRNDRGTVLPPERTDYQGQTGLTSHVQGWRFGYGTAAARLVFDTDHEIQSLAGTLVQADAYATETPSIAVPVVPCPHLLELMRQGCYLRLAHGSGFPIVIVRDGEDPDWAGPARILSANGTEPSHFERQLIVDHSGIWCPPCNQPLVLPPTARYLAGFHTAISSYPIGGIWTDDGFTTYADALIQWYVYLEASSEPFASGSKPTIYSGFFSTTKTTTDADAYAYLPAMPIKWSDPRNGVKDYRGCFSMNCPSVLTNIDMRFYSVDHDTSNALNGWASGDTDLQYIYEDIPQYVECAYWWNLQWVFDDNAQTHGSIPANSHFQVEL
jgi:hypothetical protein